jgi:anti-anti-sigma factor
MKLETQTLDGGIVKVQLSGRMDAQGTEEIEPKLMDSLGAHRAVILDLSDVSFLTSAGIRALIVAAKAVSRRGGRMALLVLDANVRKVLEIANLGQLMPIHHTLDEVLRAVSAPRSSPPGDDRTR